MSLKGWESQGQTIIHTSSDPKTKVLIAATKSGSKLHIRYSKPYGNGVSERWISPKEVFSKQDEAESYVEAHCHKRNETRVFMISRITLLGGAEGSGETKPAPSTMPSRGSASRAVTCSVDYVELDGDSGNPVDSVEVTCSRCGHITQSFGDGSASIRRCLAMMKEECPRGESNWYTE